MKDIEERQSTSVIKTTKSLTVRELLKMQSKAMALLSATLGHTRAVRRCVHPIHDIHLLFLEVMAVAWTLGCKHRGHELPQPVLNSGTEELKKLQQLFGRLNKEVLPRAGLFEPTSIGDDKWWRLGYAMHVLYACLQYENMIVGGEKWEDAMMVRHLAEGLRRAESGDQTAVSYVEEFWGPNRLF
jgi:hypothetical protein